MKVTVNKPKQFSPIELTITIESQREFEALSHLMGASLNTLKDAANSAVLSSSSIEKFTHNDLAFTNTIWRDLNP